MHTGTAAASAQSTGSATIADMMGLAAERFGDHAAGRRKVDGEWQDISYAETGAVVSELARGLIDLGLAAGDRVAILCTTCAEWAHASFAISSAGGVVVPIYPTNSPEECGYVAADSEARFVICEDAE
jgi:long-chain acyl-CoA synthetase